MPDAITCTILFPAEFQGGTNPTWTVRYQIEGSTDPVAVKAALLDQSGATYGGLVRDTYSAKEEGDGFWLGEVRYVAANSQKREPQPVGTVRETFNTGGGTQHITQGLDPTTSYSATENPAPDQKGAIGVTNDAVEGCDIVTGAYAFGRRKVFTPGEVANEFKAIIFALTGKTNNASFQGFAAGEVLFLGADGSDRDDGCYEITFSFSAKPNRTGRTVGAITGIAYQGWNYVWVLYAPKEDTDAKKITQRPLAVYVHTVYESGDFSGLGDLSVTEPS